jgi:hypothetical protein
MIIYQVAIEVMSYHARASDEEVARIAYSDIPSCNELSLACLTLNTNAFDEDSSVRSCIRMFLDFG